ncbi:MAG: hypothetical protein SAJ12_07260 [Jaaginema sp. PMC 1079.18]|nr:hypothetical protein [Jaaginema sp. PMC 1080.18]MEC4850795.1 hypothetical protein [Jaaginema sp. PMC 1079.18]MEC4868166.1 hypothetical protein [Jaaginema sp. PMC 1078.18]
MASIPQLGSSTAEGAIHELAVFLNNKQNDATTNPNNTEILTEFSRNNRDGSVSITLNLQSTASLSADGKQTIEITPVFS